MQEIQEINNRLLWLSQEYAKHISEVHKIKRDINKCFDILDKPIPTMDDRPKDLSEKEFRIAIEVVEKEKDIVKQIKKLIAQYDDPTFDYDAFVQVHDEHND